MAQPVIAISGASGQLGKLILEKLKAAQPSASIRALVRNAASVTVAGVDVRVADYDQPETLAPALAGVDTLLFVSANDIVKRLEQHKQVVAAAKNAGVKRIVYTSLLKADVTTVSLKTTHVTTEALIKDGGFAYTFLRNGWYFENDTANVTSGVAQGFFIGASGDGKFGYATRADFADAAVVVLSHLGEHDGKTYELAGDHGYTQADFAAEVSKQSGKPVVYKNLPVEEYEKALLGFGLPPLVVTLLSTAQVGASQGHINDDSHTLSKLIGHPTTSLSDFVAATLAAPPKQH